MALFAEALPGWDGKTLFYHQVFMLGALFYIGLFMAIFLFIFLVMKLSRFFIVKYKWKSYQKHEDRQNQLELLSASSEAVEQEKKILSNRIYDQEPIQESEQQEDNFNSHKENTQTSKIKKSSNKKKYPPNVSRTCMKVCQIIEDVMLWLTVIIGLILLDIISGFGDLPTSVAVILFILIFIAMIYYHARRCILSGEEQNFYDTTNWFFKICYTYIVAFKQKPVLWIILSVVFLFLSIFVPIITSGICICVYNTGYGIQVTKTLELSSEFSRSLMLPGPVCPKNIICHLYATLPEDASTSVFFNIHAGIDVTAIQVQYTNTDTNTTSYSGSVQIEIEKLDSRGKRNLFTSLLINLDPDTRYDLTFLNQNNDILRTGVYYKTLPDIDNTKNHTIKMAIGGDVGYNWRGIQMMSNVQSMDVDVIIIGGDVAYDDAMPTCYYSWDTFFSLFDNYTIQTNRIVPLITAVGNHDLGFNALATVDLKISNEGPYYFIYLPQNYADPVKKIGVPGINQTSRPTYHYHIIGNMIHISLDSGYQHSFQDQQKIINQIVKQYPKHYYYANYHVPIWPSCFNNDSFMSNPETMEQGNEFWVPLFQENKFLGCFENHVHQYKRTYPIKITLPSQWPQVVAEGQGVVYFGDGNMGIFEETCDLKFQTQVTWWRNIFATPVLTDISPSENVWILQMNSTNNSVSYYALGIQNQTMPGSQYTQILTAYK